MDFEHGVQQQLLASSARAFLDKRCPISLVQELALEERGFRDDLWHDIAALGWPGLLVPPSLGGGDGSLLDVMALVEEMGRACLPSPYIHSSVVGTSVILEAARAAGPGRGPLAAGAGPAPRLGRLLADLALGERLVAIAVLEEEGHLAAETLTMRGEVPGRLDGRKLFVKDAHLADELIVAVQSAGGPSLLLVDTARPGLSLAPMAAMSGEKLFAATFAGVEVKAGDLLGAPGDGWSLLVPALARGALARCAEMVGCAQKILDLCVEHARVRVQSGRPIGAFQAIQHACADLLRDVEGSRWIAYRAAWLLTEGREAADAVAMAKSHCGEACLRVARRAHQIMGAIGYCEEHPLHLLHKRILAGSLDFGDATLHLETVARSIGLTDG